MPKITALPELSTPAGDDYLAIVDSSEGTTKKIAASGLFGINTGWVTAGETWVYSAYSSITRIAKLTVAANATLRYTAGNRVRFDQPTGGTRYGIIMLVESTAVHVLMHADYDVKVETISEAYYALVKSPLGFDLDPAKWELTYTNGTQVNTGVIASSATIVNFTNHRLVVGVGAYDVGFSAYGQVTHAGITYLGQMIGISTTNNSFTDNALISATGTAQPFSAEYDSRVTRNKFVNLAATTTYYLNSRGTSNNSTLYVNGNANCGLTVIYARCGLL